MQTLDSFIARHANLFSIGDLAASAQMIRYPSEIHFGARSIQLRTAPEAEAVLRTFRNNLTVEDYSHSEATVLHKEAAQDGRVRLLLHWDHFNRSGAVIHETDGSYFCAQTADGAWQYIQIEILESAVTRFRAGLPIA